MDHELEAKELCVKPLYFLSYIGDASAARTTEEAEIDARVAECLEMEDPDIIIDLREVNCSGSDNTKYSGSSAKSISKNLQQFMNVDMTK